MGREKRNLPAALVGGPKERHKRAQRSQYDPATPLPHLKAKPEVPKIKHHSYYELVENKDKKKKLDYQLTNQEEPQPGFEFVPISNPELTKACKDLSREKDALIFIVSNAKSTNDDSANELALQVTRIGHHIRASIVEEARALIDQLPSHHVASAHDGIPEPIPDSQAEYDAQVDAALRHLFPRIPNTDRRMIIEHAFHRRHTRNDKKPVGQCQELTLARRVQLAVLAHIRHSHTRYDELLLQTSWKHCRKIVQSLCLDILVKWRGDEETGRDQLDEILREVVVISDSENEDSEEEETDESSVEEQETPRFSPAPMVPMVPIVPIVPINKPKPLRTATSNRRHKSKPPARLSGRLALAGAKDGVKKTDRTRAADKKDQRGFKRYQAWEDAMRRHRNEEAQPQHSAMDRTISQGSYHQHIPIVASPTSHTGSNGPDLRFINPHASLSNGPPAGHNPRQLMIHGPSSLNPSFQPNLAPPFQPTYDKVKPVYEDPRGPASPVGNRLQDLLVPSIEPPSPNGNQPSFVRTLPPQRHLPVDRSPLRSSMHRRPQPASPSRDQARGDDRAYFGRRVVSDQSPYGSAPTHGFFDDATQVPLSRDQNRLHSLEGNPVHPSPVYYSGPREPEPGLSSVPQPPRRIMVDAPKPGERFNPVLMEDRGGFYERIPAQAESRPMPHDANIIEIRRPTQNMPRVSEPHRVVSWAEGSRILQESQGDVGVEIIPISGHHTLPLEAHSHFISSEPFHMHRGLQDSPAFEPRFNAMPHSQYEETRALGNRPVSGGEYMVPPSGPRWEEQRHDDRSNATAQQHHQPVYRHHRDEHPSMEYQHGENRRHHRQPDNVIVLE